MKKDISKYNIILSVLLIAFSLWVMTQAGNYGSAVDGTAMGAGAWPKILASALLILSLVLLVRTIIECLAEKKKTADPAIPKEPVIDWRSAGMKRVYMLLGALAVYMLLLYVLGFYLATACLVPVSMIIMGERRPLKMAELTAGILLFFFVVFYLLLHLKLPVGRIFM